MNIPLTRRDRLIPWYFVIFFAIVALVNTVMIGLAVRTHTGTVTDHPYEKGLAYNKVVDAEKAQEALGWKADISYANGLLYVALRDKNNHPLAAEKITASITRPTQAGMDFTLPITAAATPVTFPTNGLWQVRIDATHEGVHYQESKRIVVP